MVQTKEKILIEFQELQKIDAIVVVVMHVLY